MDNDNKSIRGILRRKQALILLCMVGLALLVSCDEIRATADPTTLPTLPMSTRAPALTSAVLSCSIRPELPMGPYFVDDQENRSDIRSEPSDGSVKAGIPLTLAITVYDTSQNGCNPIEGARVDIWQADVEGHYSGVSDPGFDTSGQKFLRGYQLTDATGTVQFSTVYPGWYPGRSVHVHFMIRTTRADGQAYEFVSQLFFDESTTDEVYAQEPYSSRGQRDTLNASDPIYANGGENWLVDIIGDNLNGYIAIMEIGLDLTDAEVGAPSQPDGPP